MPRGGKREGAGRKTGALTTRTREVAEKAIAAGKTPLEIMLENMVHFQNVALDAEAVLSNLTADEIAQQAQSATAEDQFKFLLAQVKKTAGFRQLAQDAARDAAPYMHPKLATVAHTGADGGPIAADLTHHGTIAVSDSAAFIAEALGAGAKGASRQPGQK